MYFPFDSRKTLYKSKFGAVESGEVLTLRLLLHFDAKVRDAYLRYYNDSDKQIKEIQMLPTRTIHEYTVYECEISFEEGLYFYSFRYTSEFGEFFVTAFDFNVGHVSPDGRWWQLTCYDKNFKTPSWLSGGIIYQIFPDRFFSSKTKKENVPDDRFINGDWEKFPEHKQNNGLCSLGNDYYGGDLKGITQKLEYIHSLGVSCIYLNPIFEAHSNHRYNTADYLKIDPLLGKEEDLEELCSKAEKYGISIILDGVFSHTGDDSIYFNKYGRYGEGGAFNDPHSPYFPWYKFTTYPNEYHSWWGVSSLPEIIEENKEFDDFITGEKGVLRYWLKKGIKGWRLDVADELPDCFLYNIRKAIKDENSDAYLLGEVWEDATNKISHGGRRKYLLGKQLDSVMNYPFANAILTFMRYGVAESFMESVVTICENYPKPALDCLMNHIGTHDTARILTSLIYDSIEHKPRNIQAQCRLNDEEYRKAKELLKCATVLQYTLPGFPSIYYGDEAGVQGGGDPFNRSFFPWGAEDNDITEWYRKLGKVRNALKCLENGTFKPYSAMLSCVAYTRESEGEKIMVIANRNYHEIDYYLPDEFKYKEELLYGAQVTDFVKISANSAVIIKSN